METPDEVHEGIDSITELGKEFRHIHVDLKNEMDPAEYDTLYPEFDLHVQKVRDYVKAGRKMLKTLTGTVAEETEMAKKNSAAEEREREQRAATLRVRQSILIEEKVFKEKLKLELDDFEMNDVGSIEKSSVRLEVLLDEYFKLLSRAKIAFEDDFDVECKHLFDTTVCDIRKQIKTGKARIIELCSIEKKQLAEAEMDRNRLAMETHKKEQLSLAEILSNEIEVRSTSLVGKCNYARLEDFDDFKILDCSKNLPSLDTEMREILSKFTEFSQITAVFSDCDALVNKTCTFKDSALSCRNSYAMRLYELQTQRDISEEKLKRSSSIPIKLQEFKGYDSKLDIYSFKSEFEKLVQPTLQKGLWLDTLKKNYLSGPALVLVERMEDIEEVWKKLISSYGNVKLLLQRKMSSLDKLESLDKVKGDEKVSQALSKLINVMIDLADLAHKHNLECKLYIGGGLEKVLGLIGGPMERRFFSKTLEDDSSPSTSEVETEKRVWSNLLEFLKKELAVREKMTLVEKSRVSLGLSSKSKESKEKPSSGYVAGSSPLSDSQTKCHICYKTGHVLSIDGKGKTHCDYVSCKTFVEWSCKRRSELFHRKFCFQCLSPGIKHFENHVCSNKYVCPDDTHKSHAKGIHVLVCHDHKESQENVTILHQYMKNFIEKRGNFLDFTKNISLICTFNNIIAEVQLFKHLKNVIPDVRDRAIFPLQTIIVEGIRIRLFYDRGAGDAVIKATAIKALEKVRRAVLVKPGPIPISGVSDMKSVSEHGVYSICLPLKNGNNVIITGICMDKVTAKLPEYNLEDVEKDVQEQCSQVGGQSLVDKLPKLAGSVGGETDILLGSKYLRIHPREVWCSEDTGLSIADSFFLSEDGSTGVINGPHPLFTETEQRHWENEGHMALSYYSDAVIAYREAYQISTNTSPFGEKGDFEVTDNETCGLQQEIFFQNSNLSHVVKRPPKCVRTFDEIDSAGTEVSFRCIQCRGCDTCKKSERVDSVSFEEEVQQHLIENNVVVDIEKGRSSASLPFVTEPDVRINTVAQKNLALRVYESQVRSLNKKPEDKKAAILSESKLQELGFVDFLDNLAPEIKDNILNNVNYFIPWRIVFNPNSVSTPCRLVFDASASPRGQTSLNSLLCKGRNSLNNLVMIILRWMCCPYVFHTDISKMYNTIYLDSKHWRYQLYFWNNELKVGIAPRIKVVKTIMYGVRPSGNIAECALRKTAKLTKSLYPKAFEIIKKDIYVDDCLSGSFSEDERTVGTDQLSLALTRGGFKLKGFTFSGSHPPENLANEDKVSVTVGGQKWFPKEDVISLNIPVPDSVKQRKFKRSFEKVLDKLSRRDCVSVVYEIFDPSGRVTPIVSGLKIDLHDLVIKHLDWDDGIPDNLRKLWVSNFDDTRDSKH